jgi:hypothetical protein
MTRYSEEPGTTEDTRYQNFVSNFVADQFPAFYRDSDTNFILFMEAYYEWMQHESARGTLPEGSNYGNGPFYESRELFEYRDIDTTLERFLEHFQKKYLYGIPFSIIVNKRFLLKHILDVYRSKTNIACYRLLFKLVYGDDVRVYLPGRDMLRVSDGIWYIPRYIEVNFKEQNASLIGKTIKGLASGTTAVVEAYIREDLIDNHSNLLYISNVSPPGADFKIGELILTYNADESDSAVLAAAPTVLGSLDHLDIVSGGQDFRLGYQFQIADRQRYSYFQQFGAIGFDLVYGGFGFTANATTYVYNDLYDVTGYGANFDIFDITSNTEVEYNTDLICDITLLGNNLNLTIDAAQYGFPADPAANINSQIVPSFSFANQVFGTIYEIGNTFPGRNYTNAVTTFTRSKYTSYSLPGNIEYSSTNTAIYSARVDLPGVGYDNTDIATVVNVTIPLGKNAVIGFITDENGIIQETNIIEPGDNFNYPNPYVIFSNSTGGPSHGYGALFTLSQQAYITGNGTIFESVFANDVPIYLDANGATDSIHVREVVNNEFMWLYKNPTANSTDIFPDYPTYYVQPTIFPSAFANYEPLMFNTRYETHGENEIIAGGFGRARVNTFTHGTGGVVKANAIGRAVGSLYFDLVYGGFGYRANNLTFTYRGLLDFTGNGGSFAIGSISNLTSVEYNTDILCDRIVPDLPINSLKFDFPKNPTGNVSSVIGDCFAYEVDVFGTLADLDNIQPGLGYTQVANTFTRSTYTSNFLPGTVHYSSVNSAIYAIKTYGVTRGYSNTDYMRIINPKKGGVNATASIVTDNVGTIVDITVTNPGRDFTSRVSNTNIFIANSSGGRSNGTGGAFISINQSYVTGNGTIFQSIFTNNEIVLLSQDPAFPLQSDSVVIREVVNNEFMWLYGYPTFNSQFGSRYSVQPTVFTSSFANYEPLMFNTNFETHGKNEIITADWKGDANSVLDTAHVDSGRGYWVEETVKAYLYGAISNNIVILNGGRGYQNNDPLYFSGSDFLQAAYGYVRTNANGSIVNTFLVQQGAGYSTLPVPLVKPTGNVTEVATLRCSLIPYNTRSSISGQVVLRGYGIGRGYWLNTQGQLDNNKYIQDSYFYQDYSYELQVQKTLAQYKDIFYNTFHSAGSELFGKYFETVDELKKLRIVKESVEADTTPIGSLFRWDSTVITCDDIDVTFDRVS